jgi:hypothetical protein
LSLAADRSPQRITFTAHSVLLQQASIFGASVRGLVVSSVAGVGISEDLGKIVITCV